MEKSKKTEAKSSLNGASFQQEISNKSSIKRLSAFSNSEEFGQRLLYPSTKFYFRHINGDTRIIAYCWQFCFVI